MSSLLQIQVEFPENAERDGITEEALRDAIQALFLDLGVEPEVVQERIEGIDIRKESPLGVEPGTAALIVAVIGVGVDLIKMGVDLYKQNRDLALEKEKIALERQQYEDNKRSAEQSAQAKTGEEDLEAFIEGVLLARLIEQYGLQLSDYRVAVVERD
jgi:hypothetical protein